MTRPLLRASLVVSCVALFGCDGPPPAITDAATTPDASEPAVDAALPPDAGGDASAPRVAPIFRNAVDMSDDALALEALRIMGAPEAGGSGSCHDCHGLTRESIGHMLDLSEAAWATCFSDLEVATERDASAAISCFRQHGEYSASRLGVFAAGGWGPWFDFVFQQAYGRFWEPEHDEFTMRAAMPPDGHTPLTQAEFDIVTEWFLRGTPNVNDILRGPDMPGECTPYVGARVGEIVAASAVDGWSARNAAEGILMHGCAGVSNPAECLSDYPLASTVPAGAGWDVVPGTHTRILFEMSYSSSYWTRSSADGRFVAHGGGAGGASIIDLQRRVVIATSAAYDPGFFPDNSGFIFQGTSRGTSLCQQSVLVSDAPTALTFSESGCTGAGISLYQHVGASLDGGDYWAVNSHWSGDPGWDSQDPTLFVDPGSSVTLHALINTGSGFVPGGSTVVSIPNEGSAVLGQSARSLFTQISNASGVPIGYVMHAMDVTTDGSGARTIELPEIARYCVPGGKPATSLDDRWLVTHHRATDADAVDLGFTGPSDPGFAAYRGVSNVYLIDLLDGTTTRITNMQPGQRALFPHFRSDGWIYFQVRGSSLPEYVVASDAALVLAH